jgi:hypothetical protein
MRRRGRALHVDTFPFLAVLLCAMGSLILVLMAMDLRARKAALARGREEARRLLDQQAKALAESDSDYEAKNQALRQEWEKKRQALMAQVSKAEIALAAELRQVQSRLAEAAGRMEDEQSNLARLRERLQKEQAQLSEQHKALAAARKEAAGVTSQAACKDQARARLVDQLVRLEKVLKALKEDRDRDSQTYSIIPYLGKHGENRRPLYIECSTGGMIFHPDKLFLGENVDPARLRAEIQDRASVQMAAMRAEGAKDTRPFVMLLVRPDGILRYYRAQTVLRDLSLEFGYEFVDADWILKVPVDGPLPPNRTAAAPAPVKQRPPKRGESGYVAASTAGGTAVGFGSGPGVPIASGSFPGGSGSGPGVAGGGPTSGRVVGTGQPGFGGGTGPGGPGGPGGSNTPGLGQRGTGWPGSPGGIASGSGAANGPSGPNGTMAGLGQAGFSGGSAGRAGTQVGLGAASAVGGTPGIGGTMIGSGPTGTAGGPPGSGGTMAGLGQPGMTVGQVGPGGSMAGMAPGGAVGGTAASGGTMIGLSATGTPGGPPGSGGTMAGLGQPGMTAGQGGTGGSMAGIGPGGAVGGTPAIGGTAGGPGQAGAALGSTGTGGNTAGGQGNAGSPQPGGLATLGPASPWSNGPYQGGPAGSTSTPGNGSPNPFGIQGAANANPAAGVAAGASGSPGTLGGSGQATAAAGSAGPANSFGVQGGLASGSASMGPSGSSTNPLGMQVGSGSGSGASGGGDGSTGQAGGQGGGAGANSGPQMVGAAPSPSSTSAAGAGGAAGGGSPGIGSDSNGSPLALTIGGSHGSPAAASSSSLPPSGPPPPPSGDNPPPPFPSNPAAVVSRASGSTGTSGAPGGSRVTGSSTGEDSTLPPSRIADVPNIAPEAPPVPDRKPVILRAARVLGDGDYVVFIECCSQHLVIYPSRRRVNMDALGNNRPSNPLYQTVEQMISRRLSTLRAGEKVPRIQIRFLVHRDGDRTLHLAYPLLEGLPGEKVRYNLQPEDDVARIISTY